MVNPSPMGWAKKSRTFGPQEGREEKEVGGGA
jgi:hypothetical protein